MANEANSYAEDMKRLREDAINEALIQHELQKKYIDKQADAAHKETNRASIKDYKNYIDPYGIQSESLAEAGLSYSGVAETSYAKGYNAYQNALSNAASTAQGTKDKANNTYLGAVAQANADKFNIEADYYNTLLNNHWNQTQLDYYNNMLKQH